MRGGADAEAVITFRAEDEASEELAQIREETEGVEKGFTGLNRGMAAAALGFLGLSFGSKELIDNFQEFTKSTASVKFDLDLLGPAAVEAHAAMKPEFKSIADDATATEREVSEAFTLIIQNSGGIAPSVEELAGAFDLAKVAGIPFKEAAALVGQALQGNLEPLEALLDPSGRKSIVSLEDVLQKAGKVAGETVTPIDELATALREFGDAAAESIQPNRAVVDEWQLLLDEVNQIRDLISGEDDPDLGLERDEEGQLIAAPGTTIKTIDEIKEGISGRFLAPPSFADDVGVDFGPDFINRPMNATIIFNDTIIDSQARADQIARDILNSLRNLNRQGTNVSDQ